MKPRSRLLIGLLFVSIASMTGWYLSSSNVQAPVRTASKTPAVAKKSEPLPSVSPALAKSSVKPAALPATRPLSSIPAGAVKVPAPHPLAPPAVSEFRNWAEKYFLAEPEQREQLIDEGKKLAEAHREVIAQMIPLNPKLAIENAVPMVVRQDLPPEIVSQLEKRVNTVGNLTRYGALPVAGEQMPKTPISYQFAEKGAAPGEVTPAYVYGSRSTDWWLKETRVNGISAGGAMAIADSRVRRLEIGERFDTSKELVEICPVSGNETPLPAPAANEPQVATAETTVIEDYQRVILMCAGGHITRYSNELAAEEGKGTQYMAEGAAGGGFKPFNVNTAKTKSLLYFRIAFPDILQEPRSEDVAYDTLRKMTDYFATSSFGRFYLTPTVAPLIVLPYPEQWYIASRNGNNQPNGYGLLSSHAGEAARRMGYDTSSYNLVVYDYKGGPHTLEDGTVWGGLGGGGSVWLYGLGTGGGLDGVLAHELGHTFGLAHSNFWQPTVAGMPTSIGPGQNVEYGNKFDVMGGASSPLGHYVAPHKAQIGWLSATQRHDVRASGTYRIFQFDQGQADSDKRYALHVNKDSERDYWVEFRQNHTTMPNLMNGVMLTWSAWGNSSQAGANNGSNGGAQLIDTTPGSVPNYNVAGGGAADGRDDAGITIGRTFSDVDANVHITPILQGTTSPPYVDVVINRGPFPGNVAPTLSMSVANSSILSLSKPFSFSASGSDANGDALAYSWSFGDGTFSIDNRPTQSHTYTSAGVYYVTCTASDMKGMRTTRSVVVTAGNVPGSIFTISGTVRDPLGAPMEGVVVSNRALTNPASQAGALAFRSAVTDSNGKYTLTNLPQGGLATTTTVFATLYPYTFSPVGATQFTPLDSDKTGIDFNASAPAANSMVTITVTDGFANEGTGPANTATIVVARPPSSPDVNLDIQVLDGSSGTAILGSDYTISAAPTSGAITPVLSGGFSVGTSRVRLAATVTGANPAPRVDSVTLTLTASSDAISEGIEYAVLEFPNTTNNMPIIGPRTITIPINDAQTTLPVVKLIAVDPNAAETGKNAVMRLERNGPTTNPVTVNLTYFGEATNAVDFTGPASVVIPADSSSATFNIPAINDVIAEGTEFCTAQIQGSAAYEIDNFESDVDFYITDDDQAVLTVTASDATATEAPGNPGKFTITRATSDISLPLTVQFSLGGTALNGQDFRRIEGTAVIPAYETTVDIALDPVDDDIDEPDQTVICRLSTNDNYSIAVPGSATVTITDNDLTQFTIQSAGSGNGAYQEPGGAPALVNLFTITRSSFENAATANFTVSGTATEGADFDSIAKSLSFPAGVASMPVPINVRNDNLPEGSESIILTLTPHGSYRLGFETVATILIKDEASNPTVSVSYDDQSGSFRGMTEPGGIGSVALVSGGAGYTLVPTVTITSALGGTGSGATATAQINGGAVSRINLGSVGTNYSPADFPLTLTITGGGPGVTSVATGTATLTTAARFHFSRVGGNLAQPLNVSFSFSGTATVNNDYSPASVSTVTIPSGQSGVFLDAAVFPDTLSEGTETITATINPNAAYSIGNSSSTIYINEATADAFTGSPAPTIGFAASTSIVPERTGSAASTHTITVRLTPGSAQTYPVTVRYLLSGGSATGKGVDYNFTPGTLTFTNGGPVTQSLTLTTTPDAAPEGDETVIVRLVNPTNANLGTSLHTVTITDHAMPEVFTDELTRLPTVAAEVRGHVYPNNKGIVGAVLVSNPGTGYTDAPTISFTGGGGNGAAATALLTPSTVNTIAVNAGGTGYSSPPTITLTGGGGTGATATAVLTADVVTAINVITPGSGYTSAPVVTLTGGGGTGATATAALTATSLASVNVTAAGLSYNSAPTVVFAGGGGTGAAAIANLVPIIPLDGVGNVRIITGGTGYIDGPVVTFTGGGGSGATASATVVGGVITALTLTNPGYGYTSLPTVNINAASGTGATATATLNAGILTGLTLTNGGSGYPTAPAVVFTGGGGTGATATAVIAGGIITGINVLTPGSGYTSAPAVSITGGAGTGATAVSSLSATLAWFEWGTNAASLNKVTTKKNTGFGSNQVNFTNNIDTLPALLTYPGTYYYRAVAQNGYGITKGITRTIRTLGNSVATTLKEAGHTTTSATFAGIVNPARSNANYWFEWGTTAAYGNTTPQRLILSTTTDRSVTETITGLAEGTLVHYRLVVQSDVGTVFGGNMTVAAIAQQLAGDLLVNIHANQPSAGSAAWANLGALSGNFVASGSPALVSNVLDTGIPGVAFNGATDNYVGPLATADISGNDSRTIEVWVANPGLGSDDDIVSLGQEGALTESTLRYNNDTARGAIRHDGAANDAGYPAASFPALGKWHHLVYTYNGNKVAKVYLDGALKITKPISANLATVLNTINVGTRRNAGGTISGGSYSGFINTVRIHGGELTAAQVTTNFNLGPTLPAAAAPLASTKGASSVAPASATLNAVVVPRGSATTAWIEWGTSTAYDNASTPQSAGSGWAQSTITLPLTSLADGIEYHFRVVAQNTNGTTYGDDAVFTTGPVQNAGIVWVDLRATDATAGTATWHNRGALGNFAQVGTPSVIANAGSTGIPGVQFNGTSDVYESFALADPDISYNSDRTIEAWVLNPAYDLPDETAVSLGHEQGRRQQQLLGASNGSGFTDGTSNTLFPTPPLASAWHHLVQVHQGTQVQMYVDGVLSFTTPITDGSDTGADSVVLGAERDAASALNWTNSGFSGFINCVRIHGGALTASQITTNFLAGPCRASTTIVSPIAVTSPSPTLVTATSATLHGTVMAGGLPTTAYFQWGSSAGNLSNQTPAILLPGAFTTVAVSDAIGQLSGGMVFYRMVASSNQGHSEGATESFMPAGTIVNLPSANTLAASNVLIKTATLNGIATPNGLASQAWFEYGINIFSGVATSTTKTAITAATATKTMAVPVAGLKPHTTYWCRLVVENSAGKVVGGKLLFATGNTAPTATGGSITIKEDAITTLSLKGTDADGETLQITNVVQPAHGNVSGTSLNPVYTPEADYVGTTSFSFAVTDGAVTTASVTFTVTTTAVGDVPFAPTFGASAVEDTIKTGPTGASDPDGNPILSYAIAQAPQNGDASIAPDGTYTYEPAPDFFGTDSFTYTATDLNGTSLPGEIVVVVSGQPDPPSASDSIVGTPVSTSANGQALATDPDGDVLTFSKVADPAHGTATVNPTGQWSYAPTNGYVGTDSFTFKANDGTTDSNDGTITIIVGGPTANPAIFNGIAGDSINGTLTGNGSGTLTFTIVDEPFEGEVTLSSDGTFTYDPEDIFPITDTFTFKVNNGTLDSPPATVTLVLAPRPPNWTWIGGANAPKKPGTYGNLNVAGPNNIFGARSGFAAITDGTSNTILFGGSGIGSAATPGLLNDVWRQDAQTGEWAWRKGSSGINAQGTYGAQGLSAAANSPGGRSDFASWRGLDGRLWIFGGTGRDSSATGNGLLNDLWVYDPVTNWWTWVKGSSFINANGTYGTKSISASTNSPGARSGACAWVHADGTLWLFGGNGRSATGTTVGNLGDLWKYDPVANRWTWISGPSSLDGNGVFPTRGVASGTGIPSARSFATAWCDVDGQFYLFGGTGRGATLTTKGNLNDLWRYDPLANAWTWLTGSSAVNGAATYGTLGLPAAANTPGARSGGVSVALGDGSVRFIGGQATTGAMNDVWSYNSLTNQWAWIKGPSTPNGAATYGTKFLDAPGNTPGARRGPAAITDGSSNTLLFGGTNAANSNNDIWELEGTGLPVIRSFQVSNLTSTDGTSNTVIASEDSDVRVSIEWWPLTSPGTVTTTPEQSFLLPFIEQNVTTNLTGLTGGTMYGARVKAINAAGTAYSRVRTFTTTGSPAAVTAEFAISGSTVSEVAGWANVSIVLSGPAPADFNITVGYAGTAIAADYTAGSTTVLIAQGQTGAVISLPIVNDGLDESDETIILTLSAPTSGVTLGSTNSHTITITDDEIAPVINTPPASVFAQTGTPTTFTVAATGSNLLYQWKKNNVNITGATSSSYTIASTKTTDAGNYTCEVKNSLGAPVSAIAELFVVDVTPVSKVQATGNLSFTVNATGPSGSSITYAWSVGDSLPHRTGTATKTMTLTGLISGDTGTYTCAVSKTGTPTLNNVSGNFKLAVPNAAPEIIQAQPLPTGVVNIPYSYQVMINTDPLKTPTLFSATGLPTGFSINTTTGVISGKTTVAVNAKPITITASNASGTGPLSTLNTTLTILGLPVEAIGDFVALADRAAPNNNLGARFDLSTTALGTYTAKLIFQNTTLSAVPGSLSVTLNGGSTAVTHIGATATFVRTGKPSITVAFTSNLSTDAFTGTITDPLIGPVVTINGWHRKWSLTTPQATAYAGYYTTAFDIPQHLLGDTDIPQGSSYGSFTIGNDGKLTLAGKTADGQTFTVATITGPGGQVPFFAPFTVSPGTLIGELAINSGTSDITGTLVWTKGAAPTISKDMAYRAGFGPVTLNADGGKLPVIPNIGVFMDLDDSDLNAVISFNEGGLALGDADPVEISIRDVNATTNAQKATPAANTIKLTFLFGATPVGSFNGTFTIANPVAALSRKVTYQGIVVHNSTVGYRSTGFFLSPLLPQPGQTLATSPVLSGKVELVETGP